MKSRNHRHVGFFVAYIVAYIVVALFIVYLSVSLSSLSRPSVQKYDMLVGEVALRFVDMQYPHPDGPLSCTLLQEPSGMAAVCQPDKVHRRQLLLVGLLVAFSSLWGGLLVVLFRSRR